MVDDCVDYCICWLGGCWFRVLGFVVTLDSILGVGLSLVCGL